MQKFISIIARFGMLIPFVLTIVCLFIKNSAPEPHASNAGIAMWVFFSMFVVWLVSWFVRVGINWFKTKKEMDSQYNK